MEDKIILKFKTKNILNFYEIEPWWVRWEMYKAKKKKKEANFHVQYSTT